MHKLLLVLLALSFVGCERHAALDPGLAKLVADRRQLAIQIAGQQTNAVPGIIWDFFDNVGRNDWESASALFARMEDSLWLDRGPARPPADYIQEARRKLDVDAKLALALRSELWPPIVETYGAYKVFHEWDPKWRRLLTQDIVKSIPSGSIFGGTMDFGMSVLSVSEMSRQAKEPFYVVALNSLRDTNYIACLRRKYHQLPVLTASELNGVYNQFLKRKQDELKRLDQGETIDAKSIDGSLLAALTEINPMRETYVDGATRDMYAYLEPHGVIMKLHREPLTEISDEALQKDRDCWDKYVTELVGDWLHDDTSAKQVRDFADKIYMRRDFAGFTGDTGYVSSRATQEGIAMLRVSIARLYAWRVDHAKSPEEKSRMMSAAHIASKQAFALCPSSSGAAFSYIGSLLRNSSFDEAILVAETCSRLNPEDTFIRDALARLKKLKQEAEGGKESTFRSQPQSSVQEPARHP